MTAFCLRTGLLPNMVYKNYGEWRRGYVADDPDLGGTASKGDAEDSSKTMMVSNNNLNTHTHTRSHKENERERERERGRERLCYVLWFTFFLP
jgi:hypothetical protein